MNLKLLLSFTGILMLLLFCGNPFQPEDAPEMFSGRILIIGHRGGSPIYPENTVPAIKDGLALGADGIEIDVMLCKSGEIVVFHDYEVDSLTDGSGKVSELTFEQLRRLHFDYRPNLDERIRIPSLPEVIDSLREDLLAGKILNIELKGEEISSDGLEEMVRDLIESNNLSAVSFITSYNPYMVKRIENLNPNLLTGLLISDAVPWYIKSPRFIRWSMADFICIKSTLVDMDYLDHWQDYRVLSFIEDVADVREEHRRLLDLGIDGIITDSVAYMGTQLNLKSTTYPGTFPW